MEARGVPRAGQRGAAGTARSRELVARGTSGARDAMNDAREVRDVRGGAVNEIRDIRDSGNVTEDNYAVAGSVAASRIKKFREAAPTSRAERQAARSSGSDELWYINKNRDSLVEEGMRSFGATEFSELVVRPPHISHPTRSYKPTRSPSPPVAGRTNRFLSSSSGRPLIDDIDEEIKRALITSSPDRSAAASFRLSRDQGPLNYPSMDTLGASGFLNSLLKPDFKLDGRTDNNARRDKADNRTTENFEDDLHTLRAKLAGLLPGLGEQFYTDKGLPKPAMGEVRLISDIGIQLQTDAKYSLPPRQNIVPERAKTEGLRRDSEDDKAVKTTESELHALRAELDRLLPDLSRGFHLDEEKLRSERGEVRLIQDIGTDLQVDMKFAMAPHEKRAYEKAVAEEAQKKRDEEMKETGRQEERRKIEVRKLDELTGAFASSIPASRVADVRPIQLIEDCRKDVEFAHLAADQYFIRANQDIAAMRKMTKSLESKSKRVRHFHQQALLKEVNTADSVHRVGFRGGRRPPNNEISEFGQNHHHDGFRSGRGAFDDETPEFQYSVRRSGDLDVSYDDEDLQAEAVDKVSRESGIDHEEIVHAAKLVSVHLDIAQNSINSLINTSNAITSEPARVNSGISRSTSPINFVAVPSSEVISVAVSPSPVKTAQNSVSRVPLPHRTLEETLTAFDKQLGPDNVDTHERTNILTRIHPPFSPAGKLQYHVQRSHTKSPSALGHNDRENSKPHGTLNIFRLPPTWEYDTLAADPYLGSQGRMYSGTPLVVKGSSDEELTRRFVVRDHQGDYNRAAEDRHPSEFRSFRVGNNSNVDRKLSPPRRSGSGSAVDVYAKTSSDQAPLGPATVISSVAANLVADAINEGYSHVIQVPYDVTGPVRRVDSQETAGARVGTAYAAREAAPPQSLSRATLDYASLYHSSTTNPRPLPIEGRAIHQLREQRKQRQINQPDVGFPGYVTLAPALDPAHIVDGYDKLAPSADPPKSLEEREKYLVQMKSLRGNFIRGLR
jgi:hypothetical protein